MSVGYSTEVSSVAMFWSSPDHFPVTVTLEQMVRLCLSEFACCRYSSSQVQAVHLSNLDLMRRVVDSAPRNCASASQVLSDMVAGWLSFASSCLLNLSNLQMLPCVRCLLLLHKRWADHPRVDCVQRRRTLHWRVSARVSFLCTHIQERWGMKTPVCHMNAASYSCRRDFGFSKNLLVPYH